MLDPISKNGVVADETMMRIETKEEGYLDELESHEVFQKNTGGVEFRTVSWQRAAVIFTKLEFAMSILVIPGTFATFGAVGGGISIISWSALNTYTALLLGGFRNRHPECHMLADMMGFLWGRWGRELVGIQIVVAQILVSAAGIVSTSTAFNALSEHSACTVVFAFVSAALITMCSSVRKFSKLGWLTWFGFITFFASIFVFSVAVSQQDRPASAPQTGDFDLGFTAYVPTTFIVGMVASANLFVCTSGSSMYMPVMSEMRNPRHYKRAALIAGVAVGIIYFTFSMVIYYYCGSWLSTPAFGSAGPLFKNICYGIALPGLVIGVGLYQHVAAKVVFVRILRDTQHLQSNSLVHWGTWLCTNLALGTAAFIVAEAVPILNFLLGLSAALCFAPFSLVYPVLLWMHDFKLRGGSAGLKVKYVLNTTVCLIGLFMVVAGTYAVAVAIRDAFGSGFITKVFDCADNSASVKTHN